MIIVKSNPVVANFDVLFFSKKGFSTLARAKKIKYRPKGKKSAWLELDVSQIRRKADKQKLLFAHLESYRRESEIKNKKKRKSEERVEQKRIKKLHSSKEVTAKAKIKFRLKKIDEKIVRSKEGSDTRFQSYAFELTKLLKFVDGIESPNSIQIEQYLLAVGEEFKKLFKKHKRAHYFLRITHRYRGLKPLRRGRKIIKFDGFAIPRFKGDRISDIDSAIMVLTEMYLPRFEKYLKFATAQTSFDFLGFVLEVSLPNIK